METVTPGAYTHAYLTTENLQEISVSLNKVLFILTQSVVPFHHVIAYYCKSMIKIYQVIYQLLLPLGRQHKEQRG